MKEAEYKHLCERAAGPFDQELSNVEHSSRAFQRVLAELLTIRLGGNVILTIEEEGLLSCFRAYKSLCKPGEVFKWQTFPNCLTSPPPADRPSSTIRQDVPECARMG